MSRPRIGFVLLAAGASSRMGRPKPLLAHGDTTFLGNALRAMHATGWPVVAVVGKDAALLGPVVEATDAICAVNAQWEEGMASSIRCGLAALLEKHAVDAVLIAACDQPAITTVFFHALVTRMETTALPMVASAYAGTRGIPALFDRSCFADLLNLEGSRGAKSLLMKNPKRCAEVLIPQAAVDIDTPEDYQNWIESAEIPVAEG